MAAKKSASSSSASSQVRVRRNARAAVALRRGAPVEQLENRRLFTASISIFGLTIDNKLVQFSASDPTDITNPLPITGLASGANLVGLDVQPSTGNLYALGTDSRIYRIDPTTAVATAVNSTPFTPALTGDGYDLDVNPVTGNIQAITNSEQNLLINPSTGVATTESGIAYANGDANAGKTANISGIGFLNSYVGAASTELFGIDTGTDTLVRIGDTNGSTSSINTGQAHTIGSGLGVNVEFTGFDVGDDGSGTQVGYAAINAVGTNHTALYTVNLSTGVATEVGALGVTDQVRDIAVLPPSYQFANASTVVSETAGTATIAVKRLNETAGASTVNYSTSDGTTVAGIDYTATSGTLTFAAGATTGYISIPLINNTTLKGSTSFTVHLSTPSGGTTLVDPAMETVTIANAYKTPGITVTPATSNSNGTETFTVTLADYFGGTLTLNYATADGTAVAGTDYTATSGSTTISTGSLTQTITVPVLSGGTPGFDKTFTLNVTATSATTASVRASATGIAQNTASGGATVTDPATGLAAFLVRGTSGNDTISFKVKGKTTTLLLNGAAAATATKPKEVLIYGEAGNDTINLKGLKVPATVFGGDGNDTVTGTGANDVIDGGTGSDYLVGGGKKDILIGGSGADRLVGGGGADLEVADQTAYDDGTPSELASLHQIAAVWTSKLKYATALSEIESSAGSTGANFSASTITVDGSVDTLSGGGGTDAFFTSTADSVLDKKKNETRVNLDQGS